MTDTSDEACALACMLVSNPQGALRRDGDGWQRRVNDLIRALQSERAALVTEAASATAKVREMEEERTTIVELVQPEKRRGKMETLPEAVERWMEENVDGG